MTPELVLFLAGAILVTAGVTLIAVPAGFIVAGVLCIAAALPWGNAPQAPPAPDGDER